MKKYEWTTSSEQISGVVQTLQCEGAMFNLEIQEQDDDKVVGSVWKVIPATFWEPEDYDCIHEVEYESVAAAKNFLEIFDREAMEDEIRWEQRQDALDREYEEFMKTQSTD